MKRKEKLERVLHILWDSLQSHLPYIYDKESDAATKKFHADCTREYAEAIRLITEVL